jgi:hypothetical protein
MKYFSLIACTFLIISISACGPGSLFGPTLTPTPSSSPTPTLTPTPTATLTPTPTNTPTATSVPNGPCDNPLLPLGRQNQWTYRVTTSSGESQFSLASLGVQHAANIIAQVAYSDPKNDFTTTKLVICQAGAIVNYPLFVLNMLFSEYLDKYISAYHESGIYAPNYQSLSQNNWVLTWQDGYLTENEAYLTNPSGQADLYIPVNTDMSLSFSLSRAAESVSVPAGTFPQALQIIQDVTLPVTYVNPGGNSGTADTLHITITEWVEPWLGLLRAQITSASLQSFPSLPIQSTLELMEFKPGN